MNLSRLFKGVAGISLGLGIAEGAFWIRDAGAFPHVNFYVEDAALGVRLKPGATERISFGGNPVHTARINSGGYRGADWASAGENEIVVLGDSQVFGLGVEENETASAVLAKETGLAVRNAGVPTYGPPEYLAVLREMLASRHPKTVVVMLNFANDLFEAARPNIQRHKVWDSWAVRIETAPESVFPFSGRDWLFSQSHLVYALRRWLYTPWDPADRGLPSEGDLGDLVTTGTLPDDAVLAADISATASSVKRQDSEIDGLYFSIFGYSDRNDDLMLLALMEHATPGDILGDREAEDARSIDVTADFLRQAVQFRDQMEPKLKEWVAAHPDDARAKQYVEFVAEREKGRDILTTMADRVARPRWADTPVAAFIDQASEACDAAGAELAIVALPVDVQVSPAEWAKYGKPVQDMGATHTLLDDAVMYAHARGDRAISLIPALAAAEPGAFLNADIHMSPSGQAAAGKAIAALLVEPPPIRAGAPGLPEGRSRVPTVTELTYAEEQVVKGSTRNHCSTRQLREWFLVECRSIFDAPEITVLSGSRETMLNSGYRGSSLLTPILPGREFRARFKWKSAETDREGPWQTGEAWDFVVRWEGGNRIAEFIAASSPLPTEAVARAKTDRDVRRSLAPGLDGFTPIRGDASCGTTYSSLEDRQACALGNRAKLPKCAAGQINAGSGGFCSPICTLEADCSEGSCQDWQGAHVCL